MSSQLIQSTQMVQEALLHDRRDLPRSCPGGQCDGVYGPETAGELKQYLNDVMYEPGNDLPLPKFEGHAGGSQIRFVGVPDALDRLQRLMREDATQFRQGRAPAQPPAAITASAGPVGGSSFSMPTWGWALVGLGVVGAGIVAYQTWGE